MSDYFEDDFRYMEDIPDEEIGLAEDGNYIDFADENDEELDELGMQNQNGPRLVDINQIGRGIYSVFDEADKQRASALLTQIKAMDQNLVHELLGAHTSDGEVDWYAFVEYLMRDES